MPIHRDPADQPTCICGALLDDDHPSLCRKCSARTRYQRRRTAAQRHARPGRTAPSEPPQ